MSKDFKKGDTVWVRGTITNVHGDGDIRVMFTDFDGDPCGATFDPGQVRRPTKADKIAEMKREVARMKIEIERLENEG